MTSPLRRQTGTLEIRTRTGQGAHEIPYSSTQIVQKATASGAVGQWFESTGARYGKEAESAIGGREAAHKRFTIEEGTALLEAARAGEAISAERARDFARAVLGLDELGRLALAVLDGGLFTGSRVVELADAYLAAAGEADEATEGDPEPGEAVS